MATVTKRAKPINRVTRDARSAIASQASAAKNAARGARLTGAEIAEAIDLVQMRLPHDG